MYSKCVTRGFFDEGHDWQPQKISWKPLVPLMPPHTRHWKSFALPTFQALPTPLLLVLLSILLTFKLTRRGLLACLFLPLLILGDCRFLLVKGLFFPSGLLSLIDVVNVRSFFAACAVFLSSLLELCRGFT